MLRTELDCLIHQRYLERISEKTSVTIWSWLVILRRNLRVFIPRVFVLPNIQAPSCTSGAQNLHRHHCSNWASDNIVKKIFPDTQCSGSVLHVCSLENLVISMTLHGGTYTKVIAVVVRTGSIGGSSGGGRGVEAGFLDSSNYGPCFLTLFHLGGAATYGKVWYLRPGGSQWRSAVEGYGDNAVGVGDMSIEDECESAGPWPFVDTVSDDVRH